MVVSPWSVLLRAVLLRAVLLRAVLLGGVLLGGVCLWGVLLGAVSPGRLWSGSSVGAVPRGHRRRVRQRRTVEVVEVQMLTC